MTVDVVDRIDTKEKAVEEQKEWMADHKELKSLFHMLNGRPDGVMKVFPKDVIINFDDILNLRGLINDKLSQYDVLAKEEKIAVRFENNTFKEYSDWVVIRESLKISSLTIESINIVWDVMIKMSNYEMPQRHTIALRFCSGLKPAQIIQMMLLGNLDDVDSVDKNTFPVTCKVDCVNNLIGEEILQIVENWNKGLRYAIEDNNILKKLRKHKDMLTYIIKCSFIIIALCLISMYICYSLYKFNFNTIGELNFNNLFNIILKIPMFYILFIILKYSGNKVSDVFDKSLYMYGETHNFSITKGDLNKQNELVKSNKKNKCRVIKSSLSIVGNFMLSILASIVASILI